MPVVTRIAAGNRVMLKPSKFTPRDQRRDRLDDQRDLPRGPGPPSSTATAPHSPRSRSITWRHRGRLQHGDADSRQPSRRDRVQHPTQLNPKPAIMKLAITALNRAIAVAELDGAEVALAAVDRLEHKLADYHTYHADLLRRLGRAQKSRATYNKQSHRVGGQHLVSRLRFGGHGGLPPCQEVPRRLQQRDRRREHLPRSFGHEPGRGRRLLLVGGGSGFPLVNYLPLAPRARA
jgi:hypothetical protein